MLSSKMKTVSGFMNRGGLDTPVHDPGSPWFRTTSGRPFPRITLFNGGSGAETGSKVTLLTSKVTLFSSKSVNGRPHHLAAIILFKAPFCKKLSETCQKGVIIVTFLDTFSGQNYAEKSLFPAQKSVKKHPFQSFPGTPLVAVR